MKNINLIAIKQEKAYDFTGDGSEFASDLIVEI